MSLRNVRISLWVLVSIAVIAGGGVAIWRNTDNVMPHNAQDVARAAISGRFSLVDHTGKSVSDADFRGEWLLVFFGYTHCPDVCPTTLGTIAAVMDELGEQAANVRPLFITVDPERDTPEVMADYASAFHPKMVGSQGPSNRFGPPRKVTVSISPKPVRTNFRVTTSWIIRRSST